MKKTFFLMLGAALCVQAGAAPTPVNPLTARDPKAFVAQSAVKARLSRLLGPVRLRFFQKNFGTVSTLQADQNVAVVTGCLPHACGDDNTLLIYDRQHDRFALWLTVGGKTQQLSEQGWRLPRTLNSDTRAFLNDLS